MRLRAVPRTVLIALACLALYTGLSFLSILWAGVPGDAWEGADRTLLYLLVFALFALWPRSGSSAALLLAGWTLAMIGLAVFVFVHIDMATSLAPFFAGARLLYPAGYENAAAAMWAMVCWPALLLACARAIPWQVRGLLAGGIVVLADLALLSQSRGSLFATPIVLTLVFLLYPGRLRAFAVLVPVAAGIAATVPTVLRVGDRLQNGGDARAAMHVATVATLAAAAAVAVVVALGAAIETRTVLTEASARWLRRGIGAIALATLVAVLAGAWVAAGDPLARARHAWDTFKSPRGYAANGSGNRLISGFGSQRYDFYRVALDEFMAHPLLGIGVDNFQQQYLAHGRSEVTPHYPHSVELRTLVQTGIVGAVLALVGLGAALVAGARAVRPPPARSYRGAGASGQGAASERGDQLALTVAAAALAGFAYWVVHGSFDWFFEYAGLGAPAFALLGLACALAGPRRTPAARVQAAVAAAPRAIGGGPGFSRRRGFAMLAAALCALAVVASLVAPWLSQLEVESAARVWTTAPRTAYAQLDDAARLNPLSDEAYVVAGSIALRYDELEHAEHEFTLALARVPADAYATLELGAIASTRGDRTAALGILERAARLDPRDRVTRKALREARAGRSLNLGELNRSILREAQQFS